MIVNPAAKRILCFGDSNTWGQKALVVNAADMRYSAKARWTGVLQKNLGDDFEIIEEGLSSRTTDLDYQNKPGRNGKTYLTPCLQSQNPLDAVVVMLGTNDCKIEFGPRPAPEIAQAIEGLVTDIIRYAKNNLATSPDIILVSPARIDINAPEFTPGHYNEHSTVIAQELANFIEQVADKHHCYFVDAAQVAQAGEDGLHIDEAGHKALGELFAERIKEWVA